MSKTTSQVAIHVIALLSLLIALKLAEDIAVPILFAIVIGTVLSPLADISDRYALPRSLTAMVTVLCTVAILIIAILALEPFVSDAMARAPAFWSELEELIKRLQSVIRGIDEGIAVAIDPSENATENTGVNIPTAADALLSAPSYVAQLVIFIGTLYFFLFARADVYAWLGRVVTSIDEDTLRNAEKSVSCYFLTITIINACFAGLVTVVLHLIGVPSPVLWGVVAFFANFVLYLGPAMVAIALLICGIIVFDGPISFAPAAAFLILNMTEGQFVTPSLVGHRMSINPLLVFISLVFWLWMWGPVGGIIAIPLLVWCLTVYNEMRRVADENQHRQL
ncbi:AI-2E family transporter [Parasulfitobacter algicola]|uniref:AI-2E family transporter n=1 Tax=Parasulfitobacter algicola TaxID=2614809 RepID=A0ABX2IN82_9RHOB|nr:AI-2E family transporter [Sulfitobacter algicola]NSX54346.1 AI-2E family transporter [Sulfitobacter algicola]